MYSASADLFDKLEHSNVTVVGLSKPVKAGKHVRQAKTRNQDHGDREAGCKLRSPSVKSTSQKITRRCQAGSHEVRSASDTGDIHGLSSTLRSLEL